MRKVFGQSVAFRTSNCQAATGDVLVYLVYPGPLHITRDAQI